MSLQKKLRKIFHKTPKLLLLVVAVFLYNNYAHARRAKGGYNCNPDKKVDNPGSFVFQSLGASRIGLVLTEGTDAAGISPYGYIYKVTDAVGNSVQLPAYVRRCYDTYFITDGIISGLLPSSEYSVSLITKDKCGNTAESEPVNFSTSELMSELNAPVAKSSLGLDYYYIFGTPYRSVLSLNVDDDSGIDRIEFFVNGSHFQTVTKSGLKLFKRTTGENFESGSLYSFKGTTIEAEAHIYDLNGNVKVLTRSLTIKY